MKCLVLRNCFAILIFTNESTSSNIIFLLISFFMKYKVVFKELTVIKK